MTLVDIFRGTGTLLIIMAIAGAIAYVGDRVGHQIGRRRLTLFGIRPRYTSTIVAIGTGMLIAFSVTIVAILASREVRTAFFHMNQITTRIAQLEAQQRDLEAKVNSGELVVPVNALMTPFYLEIKQGMPVDERVGKIRQFYHEVVDYLDQNQGARGGLKPFTPPADVEKQLEERFSAPEVTAASMASDLVMFATAPQNLYRNDAIHFDLNLIPDTLLVKKGGPIYSLIVPAGQHADPRLAINELQQRVASIAQSQLHLPPFLANNVQVVALYPSLADMGKQLSSNSSGYVLTAFAYEDIYPHVLFIPIAVTLTQSK
jgi:hypothetical protein